MHYYDLAARQHGAISVPQLRQLGLSYDAIDHLVGSGQWNRRTPMVITRVGAPRTDALRCCEAVLDAGLGAALSHSSAAALWQLPGFELTPLHVTRTRKRSDTPSRLSTLHEPRCFPDHHRTVVDGIPVTVPSRIVFDVAAVWPWRAATVLDRSWGRHLLSHRTMTAMLEELGERGRKGIRLVRELMAERGPDYRPNDTNLEDRFQELCRAAGLEVERQKDLGGEEWLGRVDFVAWAVKAVLEVQSALWHDALIDKAKDAARRARMEAAGFAFYEFTDNEIFHRRAASIERLRRIARSGR